jgi:hypothetical protein
VSLRPERRASRVFLGFFASISILCLLGCSTTKEPVHVPPQPYTRIGRPDTNTVQLQIAIRKLVPIKGKAPAIWLVGTSHIGDPSYYREIQSYLDARTLVLYEGVNADAHKRRVRGHPEPEDSSDPDDHSDSAHMKPGEGPSMQATMAKSLGLVFQLDAIDYERTNFLNSDLSIQQIQRLMVGQDKDAPDSAATIPGGPTTNNSSFSYLMQVMDESSLLGSLMKLGLQFVGSSPKLQGMAKLALIETLGSLKGEFAEMRGIPPDLKQLIKVLIEARNQNVVEDLKTEAKNIPQRGSIAVFYGTGHMEDMQRRITQDLNYQPAGDIWLTAFSVDLAKAGLSDSEVQTLRNMIKWQMEQLQPK